MESTPKQFILKTLGAPSVENPSFSQPKPLLVFTYLLLEGRSGEVTRERLAELFWQSAKESREQSLRQCLNSLRAVFGEEIVPKNLNASSPIYRLGEVDISTDLELLDVACDKLDLTEIKNLYQGPFFESVTTSRSKRKSLSNDIEEWIQQRQSRVEFNIWKAYFKASYPLHENSSTMLEECFTLLGRFPEEHKELIELYVFLKKGKSDLAIAVQKELEDLGFEKNVDLNEILVNFGAEIDSTSVVEYSTKERDRQSQILLQRMEDTWIKDYLKLQQENSVNTFDKHFEPKPQYINHPTRNDWLVNDAHNKKVNVETLFADFTQSADHLLILGKAGSGKTTALLEIIEKLLNLAAHNTLYPIPVLFNLSNWSQQNSSSKEWLIQELTSQKYRIPEVFATSWISTGRIIPILDDLDRVADKAREHCVECINHYENILLPNIIVACRTEDYENFPQKLLFSKAVELQPLAAKDVIEYFDAKQNSLKHIAKILIENEELCNVVDTPLMVDIIERTYDGNDLSELQHLSANHSPETVKEEIFDSYIERMLSHQHYRDKGYSSNDITENLIWFAKTFKEHYSNIFFISELQPSSLTDMHFRWLYLVVSRSFILICLGFLLGLFLGGSSSLVRILSNGTAILHLSFSEYLSLGVFMGVVLSPFSILFDFFRIRKKTRNPLWITIITVILGSITVGILGWPLINTSIFVKISILTFNLVLFWFYIILTVRVNSPLSKLPSDNLEHDNHNTFFLWENDIEDKLYVTGISLWSFATATRTILQNGSRFYKWLFGFNLISWIILFLTVFNVVPLIPDWPNLLIMFLIVQLCLIALIVIEGIPPATIVFEKLRKRPEGIEPFLTFFHYTLIRGILFGMLTLLTTYFIAFLFVFNLTKAADIAHQNFLIGWNSGYGILVTFFFSGLFVTYLLSQFFVDAIKHIILRLLLKLCYGIPLNLCRSLINASEHVFLRRVGDGFQFYHNLLLEHFSKKTFVSKE